jgi:hypothetical protein
MGGEEGKKKNEERKEFGQGLRGGRKFSIFVFPSSFFSVVSVPVGRKKEKRRTKNEKNSVKT